MSTEPTDNTDTSITNIIRTHIKPGKEQEYEELIHGINGDAMRFAGFQGATILRPGDSSHSHPEYVIVVRFATYDDARRWEQSPEFAEWQRRFEPLLLDDPDVNELTGMEAWFTLPGHSVVVPPPKYKMAVVTTLGVAPFVLVLIPILIALLSDIMPPVLVSLMILLLMSVSMTWVIMPLFTRLARWWLYPTK